MNRVFLETGGATTPATLKAALKGGRTFASNGPLLGLELDGKRPGDTVTRTAPASCAIAIALRSPVAVDHLELVYNGKVAKAFVLSGDRRSLDVSGELEATSGGWLLLRAWNDGSDPLVLDLYPYATTSPVYLELPGGAPKAPADAAYFAAWLDRVIGEAERRDDYNNPRERQATLDYLRKARDHFRGMATVKSP